MTIEQYYEKLSSEIHEDVQKMKENPNVLKEFLEKNVLKHKENS